MAYAAEEYMNNKTVMKHFTLILQFYKSIKPTYKIKLHRTIK